MYSEKLTFAVIELLLRQNRGNQGRLDSLFTFFSFTLRYVMWQVRGKAHGTRPKFSAQVSGTRNWYQ